MTTKRAVKVVGKMGGVKEYRKVRVTDPASVSVSCARWNDVYSQGFSVRIDGETFACDHQGGLSSATGFVVLMREGDEEPLLCDDARVVGSINKYVCAKMLHGLNAAGFKVMESRDLEILKTGEARKFLKLMEIPHPGRGWWY